jgi:hypothetical protein
MQSAGWARAASLLLLGALTSWACSDSSSGGPNGVGGSSAGGGDAGASADAGRQSSAGEAGSGADPCLAEPDSKACREVPWCGPFQVTEVCGPTPFPLCPSSLANFIERTPCDTVTLLEVYDTSCGGKVLVRSFGARNESWEFDETDTLVSVRVEADSLHICFEGGRSRSWLYGDEPCERDAASKVDVCAAPGGSGAGGAAGSDAGGAGGAGSVDVGGAGGAG